jgi:hypothetical protein
MRRDDQERRDVAMDELASARRGATVDPASVEVGQWRRFVGLLLLLVQSGRLDPADGLALVDALGHPPDIARGRSALFEIVRRHEPDACGTGSR